VRVIIAGSRAFDGVFTVIRAIKDSGWADSIDEVVCGGAKGVDTIGKRWAEAMGIPVKMFNADWSVGPGAGPIRNEQMAKDADALILVWDGSSRGSADMLRRAKAHGLRIHEHVIGDDE
jgi:hypothetical protein